MFLCDCLVLKLRGCLVDRCPVMSNYLGCLTKTCWASLWDERTSFLLSSHCFLSTQQTKDELDKDEEKPALMAAVRPTVGKRGRPQIRTTPNSSTGRSKTSSSEGLSNCRSSRTDTSSMANGDSKLYRACRYQRNPLSSALYCQKCSLIWFHQHMNLSDIQFLAHRV